MVLAEVTDGNFLIINQNKSRAKARFCFAKKEGGTCCSSPYSLHVARGFSVCVNSRNDVDGHTGFFGVVNDVRALLIGLNLRQPVRTADVFLLPRTQNPHIVTHLPSPPFLASKFLARCANTGDTYYYDLGHPARRDKLVASRTQHATKRYAGVQLCTIGVCQFPSNFQGRTIGAARPSTHVSHNSPRFLVKDQECTLILDYHLVILCQPFGRLRVNSASAPRRGG